MSKLNFLFLNLKKKLALAVLVIALFVGPTYTFAAIVYETTDWIVGTEALSLEWAADVSPYTYLVTFTDLSLSPFFGFDFLFLSVTSSTDVLDSIVGPGSFTIDVEPGRAYWANIMATGGGTNRTGMFGLEVAAAPIPGAIWILASGLIAIVGVKNKRKFKK